MSLLANNLILLYLQVCRIQDESITKGRVEGKNRIHAEGLHYVALEKKRRLGLEVCRLDGAGWIHADTALLMNWRTWPRLYRRFKEDSYRHSADDEWENLAWTPQQGGFIQTQG
jgi:hypothetical protein